MIDNEVQVIKKSEYYNALAWMGLLGTEEAQINEVRSHDTEIFENLELSKEDIYQTEGLVSYLNPHFSYNPKYKDKTEIWLNGKYINPKVVTWVETSNMLYGVLDNLYEEEYTARLPIKCYFNEYILFRYSAAVSGTGARTYTKTIDISSPEFSGVSNIENSIFFISQSKLYIPTIETINETTLKITATWRKDIDLFICSNLVNVINVEANIGVPVINQTDPVCYHRMFVDDSADYEIDCRFYPYIKVDKDCVVRVLKDSSHAVPNPVSARLVNYSEYIDIEDPYNTDNEYFNSLDHVTDIINSLDSDEVILDKFSRIAKYCYRLWETYPFAYPLSKNYWNTSEQSDFVICDNKQFGKETFVRKSVRFTSGTKTVIMSTVPVEQYRDLMFYQGNVFSDYTIVPLRYILVGGTYRWTEDHVYGTDTYIIDNSYVEDDLTLVKFNTFEDSTYVNIDQYFNSDHINRLHFKMDRFYRNLLIIRNEYINTDKVRVSDVAPSVYDKYLWYELLVNVTPTTFEEGISDTIRLYGLDPEQIPEELLREPYDIGINKNDGPESYGTTIPRFFDLSRARQEVVTQSSQSNNDPVSEGDNKLYDIKYGTDTPQTIDEGDLWYEFLDVVDGRVVYSDHDSMVLRMDERLLLLKFDHDNIQTYAFDDIVMNFKGKLGIRYMTLLADLIDSNEIKPSDINILWKRLITFGDEFNPKMHRLYTGKSFVVSTPKIDTSDYSIIYSTNIGRFRINYAEDSTTRLERQSAYRMCIDYTTREGFAYLADRMMVFVNGKYISRHNCREVAAYMLYIDNFDEVISTVDIFYMKKDQLLMDLKREAYKYWPTLDTSEYIEKPYENYKTMEKINMIDHTYKGYYDVLLYELIFNGKLYAMLNYLEEHQDESEAYRRDLLYKYHAISDTDLAEIDHIDSRIIIPAFSESDDTPYQIGVQSNDPPNYHIWDGWYQ